VSTSSGSIPPPSSLAYTGAVVVPFINRTFNPQTTFNTFPVPTIWVNTASSTAFILVSKADGVAVWIRIGATSPSSFTWNVISASEAMASNNGYVCVSPGGALALSLPVVSAVGDLIEVTLDGSTSFSVTQGAGQQIRMGNLSTTAGVGGSISSTAQGDSIQMVCSVADLKWNILSTTGNPTIV